MHATSTVAFDHADLGSRLDDMPDEALDGLEFGVIAFDAATIITSYNAYESLAAGLAPGRVLGRPLFDVVAPCMNNFMIALRFEDAALNAQALDTTMPYVLTLRMKPAKVKLRLIAQTGAPRRYVLVLRKT